MAELSKDGRIIISAKEVASYLHCPESWNLLHRQKIILSEQTSEPERLERKKLWLEDFDAARYFTWATNLIIFMIFFLIILYLFTQIRSF